MAGMPPKKQPAPARQAFEQGGMAEGLPTIRAKLPGRILESGVAAGSRIPAPKPRKLIANNGLKLNERSRVRAIRA